MGRNTVPGVPDRTPAALHSVVGSVARGPPGLVPTGVGEQEVVMGLQRQVLGSHLPQSRLDGDGAWREWSTVSPQLRVS